MCQVKSSNECNPYAYSRRKPPATEAEAPGSAFRLRRLTAKSRRKVRIMSSRHTLHRLGYPYDTMAFTMGSEVLFLS